MKALARLAVTVPVATLTLLSACADTPATAPDAVRPVSLGRPSLAVDPVAGTTVLDLGTLPEFSSHDAWDINAGGWVVGTAGGPTRSAFIWKPGVGMAPLAPLAGYSGSVALGINAVGEVAGFSDRSPNDHTPRATLWRNGSALDLGTLNPTSPTHLASFATDVNDAGVVVGTSEIGRTTPDLPLRLAFRWTQAGGMVALPAPAGTGVAEAHAINSAGQIVGYIQPLNGVARAAMWSGGTFIDLGALPGSPDSRAWGINNAALVVGTSPLEFPASRGFTWTQASGMVQLPPIPGSPVGAFSEAFGVNDLGDVVGATTMSFLDNPGVLWRGQSAFPLPRLTVEGREIAVARAINNVGQIAGSVQPATGPARAVLWTLPANRPPVAAAGGPYAGRKKKEGITFDGTASSDPDGNVLTYVWNFGDDSPTATGATPTHVYERFGTYAVTLTVSDGRGGSATATATVEIAPPGKLDR